MGCMPAEVKRVVASPSGTREALGITTWPFFLKNSKYLVRISWMVIGETILL